MATYPPEEFPHLYPKPIEYYERCLRYYVNMNHFILLAGLILWVVYLTDGSFVAGDGGKVFPYFMLQSLPMIFAEIWTFKWYKHMRDANTRTTRSAQLVPRRFLDFVSPVGLGMVLFVYVAFFAFIVYMKQFDHPWFGGYINVVILTAGNLFFAAILAWNIYGKKQNPHQSFEDRVLRTRLIAKQMIIISIAMTVYAVITIALSHFEVRDLQPTAMSLYFQVLVLITLRTLRIEKMNFEVYKECPVAT